MAEAFTAGVKPGGLTDDTQIRILLCYLVKTAGPLTRDTLQGALLQEQLVNYFEFADALVDVEKQQLVAQDESGLYSITEKGSTVADTLALDLPRTVRESAIRAVMQIQSWRHKAAMNRARVEEEDGEYTVWCAIGDLGSDVFRLQLAMVLQAIVSQQLVPTVDGGVTPAWEIMVSTPAIRNLIREEKTHQIDSAIAARGDLGMRTMDQSLFALVESGRVARDVALQYAVHQEALERRLTAAGL